MSVKVNGLNYAIRITDVPLSSDLDGESLLSDCQITIRADMPTQRQQQTFVHELLHIVLEGEPIGSGRTKRDEEFVTRVSNTIFSVLEENKLLSPGWWQKIVDEHTYLEPKLPASFRKEETRGRNANRSKRNGIS